MKGIYYHRLKGWWYGAEVPALRTDLFLAVDCHDSHGHKIDCD